MAHWRNILPLRMIEVRYEDLVARQEALSRELMAFCGLEWEDSCLKFHKNPRSVPTASAFQVRRPMYTSSIGRWKNYAAHLDPLRQALGLLSGILPSPTATGSVQRSLTTLSRPVDLPVLSRGRPPSDPGLPESR